MNQKKSSKPPSKTKMFDSPVHVGRPNVGSRVEFNRLVDGIFERNMLSNSGPMVEQFEKQIADYLGVKHCVSIVNGTVALEIAVKALGLSGEVIVPSYTFIATAHALHWQGITPVFADIDSHTHNLDPASVRSKITPSTTGIIGVHLWGQPAPIHELEMIAEEHGLKLLFDAAHAFSNQYAGKKIGNFGNAEVLSFHATKFFNTFEGGAVVTNDGDLAEKVRLMRNFGFVDFDKVIYPGTNGKMTEICAAMGIVNLKSIEVFVNTNKKNYSAYKEVFSSSTDVTLFPYDESLNGNHQYVVIELSQDKVKYRDRLVDDLHAENVRARRYFWPGCHNMLPYKELFPMAGRDLLNTMQVAERVIVLPTGTAVDEDECRRIAGYILSRLRVLSSNTAP